MNGSSDEQLSAALRERGQRVTTQRIVLLRALRQLGAHTSADELLQTVQDALPALSLPTVYATLDLFEELGLVRRVAVGSGPGLYEPVLDGHHHLVCRTCGGVEDVRAPVDLVPAIAATGGRAVSAEVVLSGLCADCAQPG